MEFVNLHLLRSETKTIEAKVRHRVTGDRNHRKRGSLTAVQPNAKSHAAGGFVADAAPRPLQTRENASVRVLLTQA
jgi:hypothetical protein